MKFSTILGAAIGSAIDGSDGDDSTLDGAIGGAVAAAAIAHAGARWRSPLRPAGWCCAAIGKLQDRHSATPPAE